MATLQRESGAPSGVPGPDRTMPRGTDEAAHLCQLYRDHEELLATLVPYFHSGLLANERCLWVTAPPLAAADARAALAAVVPDLAAREAADQIEILDRDAWLARMGALTPDEMSANWLQREHAALAAGHSGLRISGNSAFAGEDARFSVLDYEAAAHRAFAGRRIRALCSYPLDSGGADALLDVLRNHDAALVRRHEEWELVRSATALVGLVDQPTAAIAQQVSGHLVQFHDERYEAAAIAAFLAAGVDSGGGLLVLATPPNHAAIVHELAARGLDVEALATEGRLVALDAQPSLDAICLAGGEPTFEGLAAVVGPPVLALAERYGAVHAYGEMVDLLAIEGRLDSALTLEAAWNALLAGKPARLLCGYHLAAFDEHAAGEPLRAVCAVHDHVQPGAGATVGGDQLVAELQQRTRQARLAAEQLARLQTITGALAEAVTLADVERVVAAEVAAAVGATSALLAVTDDEGGRLRALAAPGDGFTGPRPVDGIPPGLRAPLAEAYRSGVPVWSGQGAPDVARLARRAAYPGRVVCLPVNVGRRRLGALALQLADEQRLGPTQRALLEDAAHQIGVAVDRAALYESVAAARQAAERASRAKDEFLAMLGHELRNPLSPIVTSLHLMKLRDGAGVLERERAVIERQVEHLRRLVEDLLDVSRITRGKVRLERRPVELAEVAAAAIETAGPLLEQRAQLLTVDVPPGIVVDADPTRLAQVLGNLLLNAAKYTPNEGHVWLQASAAQGRATVKVRDDGMGIAPELLPDVFDSFVQGPRTRERSEGGLGLGLAIVKSLVQMHGGRVHAASEGAGRGAELTVELPLAGAARWHLVSGDERAVDVADAHGLRVLVVDDNVDAAQSLAELLRVLGCEARVAHDGPSALIAAQEHTPRLVLLDIGLPVMDGYEVAQRLRELPSLRTSRVIALTGYGQSEDRLRSRRAGFDDHLVKPLQPERLRALVGDIAAADGAASVTPLF